MKFGFRSKCLATTKGRYVLRILSSIDNWNNIQNGRHDNRQYFIVVKMEKSWVPGRRSGHQCLDQQPGHLAGPWWRREMETFSELLAICAGHRWIPRTKASDARRFDVYFDLRLNIRLSNNGEAGDLRRHFNAKSGVSVSSSQFHITWIQRNRPMWSMMWTSLKYFVP